MAAVSSQLSKDLVTTLKFSLLNFSKEIKAFILFPNLIEWGEEGMLGQKSQ
jgi:hypothetical protein